MAEFIDKLPEVREIYHADDVTQGRHGMSLKGIVSD